MVHLLSLMLGRTEFWSSGELGLTELDYGLSAHHTSELLGPKDRCHSYIHPEFECRTPRLLHTKPIGIRNRIVVVGTWTSGGQYHVAWTRALGSMPGIREPYYDSSRAQDYRR